MTRVILLALSLLFAISSIAGNRISSPRQQELHSLLTQDCGSCHGLTLKGGLGPALLPRNLRGKSVEYLSDVILDGRPGTAMPPWRSLLSPAEARWIAKHLLEENSK